MISVNHLLVMHRRVNGGDGAGLNAIGVIEQFNDRNNAVGGAGGVGDNAMPGAKFILIYAVHHRRVEVVAAGVGKEHFFRPRLKMHLLKYDTSHGRFAWDVRQEREQLFVGDDAIRLLHEPTIAALPWRELAVDVVLDCTGVYAARAPDGHPRRNGHGWCHISINARCPRHPPAH